ncbi:MAG: hypothetical protein NTY30_02420 [Candidatus Berkelbacteria bacterium]|nr:hypothetical protein [Candidatus Berkelbacteria bacterium]
MSKLIYLETDEEITDVIDKISKVEDKSVSLVIPRGSTLANSIVNLKLLVKRSKALKKEVALVTNDNIAHNLASQIGLPVYESLDDARKGIEEKEVEDAPTIRKANVGTPTESVGGVKVHQYDRDGSEDMTEENSKFEIQNPNEREIAESPEVIEAVRDADSTTLAETQIGADKLQDEDEMIQESDIYPKPIPEPINEKSDYKLVKKPMEPEMRHRELSHGDMGSNQVFGKMRGAKNRRRTIIGVISGVLILLLVLGAYVALPKATVRLSVVSEPFNSTADIKVSKDATVVNAPTSTIPGKITSDEQDLTKPFAATGTKNIGKAASGKVTVYNNWDQNAVSLPSGSKFVSASGINFVSTAAASIPGATVGLQNGQFVIISSGTADVNVQATEVGEQGNIGATNFTITSLPSAQQPKIYGKSTAAMTGGTNQVVKIVTDKDIADAKASTENELKDTITNKIKAGLAGSEKLLDSAILPSVTSENASAKVGDQVDTFNYTAKIKINALTFSEDDFKTVLLENAKLKLAADKQIVTNNSQNVKYEVASADVATGTITLKGTFDGFISGKYDTNAMKLAIKFKSVTAATTKLTSYPGVLSADISTSPRFLRSLPALAKRITIEFNYGSTSLTTSGTK